MANRADASLPSSSSSSSALAGTGSSMALVSGVCEGGVGHDCGIMAMSYSRLCRRWRSHSVRPSCASIA